MDKFDEQQNSTGMQQSQNMGQRWGLAIASLIWGILSIVLLITIIFPFALGILAIVFGALSLKSQKKGMAIAGIITGAIGLFLAILIIVIGMVWSPSFLENDSNNSLITSDSSHNSQSSNDNDITETFYGDGFELTYNGLIWTPTTETIGDSDKTVHALKYVLDETILMPSEVSGMSGYSTATRAERDDMYEAFYDVAVSSSNLSAYIVGDTDTFEVLKDDIYYAAYSLYGKDDELLYKIYVIASERDDAVVPFFALTSFLTKEAPDIPIMPVLESITFTGSTAFADSYEQKVWESGDEYTIGDGLIPSLSKIMNDNNISYTYTEGEKTIGKMAVPSILDYVQAPELVSVEIIEIIYNDVDDAWGAIDAYGGLLYETYDFYVTCPPEGYPNYGEGYRFCELIKDTDSDEDEIIYVAAIYSRDENIIKVQFGTIGTKFSSVTANGIGALNLKAIRRGGTKP